MYKRQVSSLKERALAAVLPWIIKIGSWLKETAKDVIAYTKHTNILKTGIIFLGAVIAAKLIPALYSAAEALGLLDAETLIPLAAIVLLSLIHISRESVVACTRRALASLFLPPTVTRR